MSDERIIQTPEQTQSHLAMHYKASLRELNDDGIIPNADGLTNFAISLIATDIIRRSKGGRMPWDWVLQHVYNQLLLVLRKLQAGGKLNGAVPEQGTIEESDEGAA